MNKTHPDTQSVDEQMLLLIKKTAGLPRSGSWNAAWRGELDRLVSQGACLNGAQGDGPLLQAAVQAQDLALVRQLLELGANPNAALQVQGLNTSVQSVRVAAELLDRCKALNSSIGGEDLNRPMASTCLHEAVLPQTWQIFPAHILVNLLAFGADPRATNGLGLTPLDLADSLQRAHLESLLFQPLHAAVSICKDIGLCRRLVEQGHSEEGLNPQGQTPAMLAKDFGLVEISALFDAVKAMRAVDAVLSFQPKPPMKRTAW